MSTTSLELVAGQSVAHPEMGDGVVVAIEPGGYARVFFRAHGERQVSVASLSGELSWEEQAHMTTVGRSVRVYVFFMICPLCTVFRLRN